MSESSPERRYRPRMNPSSLDQAILKSSYTAMANAACIDNLLKKNTMFVPQNISSFKPDINGKFSFAHSPIKYKKQIEPHKFKANISMIEKSKSNLLQEKNSKNSKNSNKKNIGAIVKRPSSREPGSSLGALVPPTASFYLRKGEKPIYLELKMDIKKVESRCKGTETSEISPEKRTSQKLGKRKNFPKISYSDLQRADSSLIDCHSGLEAPNRQDQDYIKESDLIFGPKEQRKFLHHPSSKEIHSMIGLEKETVIRYQNERTIKSTLTSYLKVKPSKKKEQFQNASPWHLHIKDVVKKPETCDEELLKMVEEQMIHEEAHEEKPIFQQLINSKTAECLEVGLFNHKTQRLVSIFSRERTKKVQIASITKIMTCLLILKIAEVFHLDIKNQKCTVSEKASKMPGTSAFLTYSDCLTVYDLLHGLMLPSGNDAAVALGDWGGKIIRKYCSLGQKYIKEKSKEVKQTAIAAELLADKKTFQKLFIFHMNKTASILKMKSTFFANTHGLMNERSHSTAKDIAKLTCIAMKIPTFRQIVRTKEFQCKIYNKRYGQERKSIWKNTNKLLNQNGFMGVKTGVTPSAGPCLSSMFRVGHDESIVIIVLKVKSMEYRFKESLSLLELALQKLSGKRFEKILKQIRQKHLYTSSSLKQSEEEATAEMNQEKDEENEDQDPPEQWNDDEDGGENKQ